MPGDVWASSLAASAGSSIRAPARAASRALIPTPSTQPTGAVWPTANEPISPVNTNAGETGRLAPDQLHGLAHRGERRVHEAGRSFIVEADHGDIVRYSAPGTVQRAQGSRGEGIHRRKEPIENYPPLDESFDSRRAFRRVGIGFIGETYQGPVIREAGLCQSPAIAGESLPDKMILPCRAQRRNGPAAAFDQISGRPVAAVLIVGADDGRPVICGCGINEDHR